MTIEELIKETEDRMKKSLEATRHEFTLIRTGRANPSILENVIANFYGQEMPVNQLANITVPEPRQLLITPWDKNALGAIEKGIMKSDLNPHQRWNIHPLNHSRSQRGAPQGVHQTIAQEGGNRSRRNSQHTA
jgi:ribosome recycling factor